MESLALAESIHATGKSVHTPCQRVHTRGECVHNTLKFEITGLKWYDNNNTRLSRLFEEECTAPLYQQIVDWFKENHGIRFKTEPTIENKIDVFIYDLGWKYFGTFNKNEEPEALNKAIEEAFKLI